ncbi:MAG: hypothetical protein JSV91_15350 [Phycisphaerales bacterium]|nr:MAG: hypothetical protein JSV91_15350 [Phycisphaerales bacterium]
MLRSLICHNGFIPCCAACLSLVVVNLAVGDEIHVHEGESIQAAIDGAMDGDEIVVHPATYHELINFSGKAITLRSTDPADPAVVVSTIIDGDGAGTVVTCNSGEASNTVLSGFVITNGYAVPAGGGMHNSGSSPTITHCTFADNFAHDLGGGMCNRNASCPTVVNCTFINNLCSDIGGGMYSSHSSSPTVANCTFIGNSSNHDGGGMYNCGGSPTVTNCTFTGNSAGEYGGGICIGYLSSTTVADSVICANTPDQIIGDYTDGGGNLIAQYAPPPPPAAPTGACCLGEGCLDLSEAYCDEAGGVYMGDDTACVGVECPDPCPEDINYDGKVNIDDIFAVLAAWGPCP